MNRWLQACGCVGLLVLLIGMAACEDSDRLAASDSTITLTAIPTNVVIDAVNSGAVEGTTTLSAQVLDANGFPEEGVIVTFETSNGLLAGAATGETTSRRETNGNGVATETLTVRVSDPQSFDVSVSSSTLIASTPVTWSVSDLPAVAMISVTPQLQQSAGEPVTLDGSGSMDPDGEAIQCYKWEFSLSDGRSFFRQGQSREQVTLVFQRDDGMAPLDETELAFGVGGSVFLDVDLFVSSDPGVFGSCGSNSGEIENTLLSQASASVENYEITCDLSPPQADAGDTATVQLAQNGVVRQSVDVQLDGRGSTDDQSGIVSYEWDCDTGDPLQTGAQPTCTFTAERTYNVDLTVTNGCGQIGTDSVDVNVVCDESGPVANTNSGNITRDLSDSGGTVTVDVNGNLSDDAQSGLASFVWDCGNNSQIFSTATGQCQYTVSGFYNVRLTVENGCGQTSTDQFTVTVVN